MTVDLHVQDPGAPERRADRSREGTMADTHDREHAFAEELAAARAAARAPGSSRYPLKRDVATFADTLLGLLFPQLSDDGAASPDELQAGLTLVRRDLARLLVPLVPSERIEDVVIDFAAALPRVHAKLTLDAQAIVAGDPAAESIDEVVAAYPGFLAIAIHRLAHELYAARVPVLPRLLSEVAHTRTGIDIHPGATIGERFCIDHGTGVVVGETSVIGDDVKLYQGVTLGALSVSKDKAGTKRHPTIGNRVVIYANATVLGGETVVGQDSVVGGNVFLTHGVPPNSLVSQAGQSRLRRVSDGFEDSDFVI
jgi:serine O-acetyltransferase